MKLASRSWWFRRRLFYLNWAPALWALVLGLFALLQFAIMQLVPRAHSPAKGDGCDVTREGSGDRENWPEQ